MFKFVRYGLAIAALTLPLLTQAAQDSSTYAQPCDFSFTATPAFANQCFGVIQQGTYTLRNNTPVAVNINYIRIQNLDVLPTSATQIVVAPTSNCGTSLAAGASCNILVNLQSLATVGTFNRVLQVGIDTRQVEVDASAIGSSVLNCAPPPPGPPAAPTVPGTPASLFSASILAFSTVTNTGPSVVNGDLDLSPGTAVTGFPPGTIVNGVINAANATAATARTDAINYYNALVALPCTANLTGQDLGGLTLTPGVYCFNTSAQLTGALTLAGAGNYTFKIGSTLTTASNSSVVLTGGATNGNVNWAIGSSATLGTGTAFQGIIVATASITLNTGASLLGRAWALNGAVTLDNNAVNPN